jgi:hypothetical protein
MIPFSRRALGAIDPVASAPGASSGWHGHFATGTPISDRPRRCSAATKRRGEPTDKAFYNWESCSETLSGQLSCPHRSPRHPICARSSEELANLKVAHSSTEG